MGLSLAAVALVLAINLPAGAESLPKGQAGQFLIARAAEQRADWTSATEAYQALLTATPDDSDLRHRYSLLLLNQGDADLALASADRLLTKPEHAHLPRLLAFTDHIRRQDLNAARRDLSAIGDDGIGKFLKPFLSAWLTAASGKTGEMTQTLSPVASVALLRPMLQLHTALLSELAGQTETARAVYRELLSAPPTPRLLIQASRFYHRQQLKEPLARLLQSAEKTVTDPVLLNALRSGTLGTAAPSIAEGLAQVFYDLAGLLIGEGAQDVALPYLRLAQALAPQDPFISLALADLLQRAEQTALARTLYVGLLLHPALGGQAALRLAALDQDDTVITPLLERFPDWSDARLLQAGLMAPRTALDRAREIYTAALQQLPRTAADTHRTDLLQARARLLHQQGDASAAEHDLRQAIALRPEDPHLLNALGYLLAEQGEKLEEAESLIRRALAWVPSSAAIQDSLGWVLYRQGKMTEAVTWLEKASQTRPYDSTINDHLGDAYWAAGRAREARFQWARALRYRDAVESEPISAGDLRRKLDRAVPVQVSAEHHSP